MYVGCDIRSGDVYVFDTTVICGGNVLTHEAIGVTVSGVTSLARIFMTDTRISLRLSNTFISSSAPITVQRSSVDIVPEGTNLLFATGRNASAIDCRELSNLLFSAVAYGSLTVEGGDYGAGIGPSPQGTCNSLTFLNGTFDVRGADHGPGIGSGMSTSGTTQVGAITIESGTFNVWAGYAAGIGSGFSDHGNTFVDRLTIRGGTSTSR
jgi:hypothetical protein